MIISENLLKEVMSEFQSKKELDCVIENSLPVLFFGDLKSYVKNDFKVVTAAINPSDMEFKKERGQRWHSTKIRFKDFDGSYESLEVACSNYFKRNTYYEWFGKNKKDWNKGFKPILNSMGYCYFPNKENLKSVLHTDLCSPLATTEKWNDVSTEDKNQLIETGFPLWKRLINEIKPNLIIMSMAKKHIYRLNPKFIKSIYVKNDRYAVEFYSINLDGFKTNLIWGSAQDTPFQPFSNKSEIGELIIKCIKDEGLM
tara:strand:+ start:312 stop:1079 length:768 start_codon:yes stop_codon:yes gene_type:complete